MDATGNDVISIPRLGRYTIDTGRSSLTFGTRHRFGLLPVRGTFAVRGGTIDVAEPLAESSVRAEIDATGFRTGNDQRDTAVRSERFLDAERHPVITFVSDHVDPAVISGQLTVRAVTRPVRLSVVRSEVLGGSFTVRATTSVDRTEFGITRSGLLARRHVDLTLDVMCVRI
ncbi:MULTISPECIES: YceI family protein [Streptomyces]|uniref:YceI family protein n=1 Tax=Streptomyces TaxID=1883 RepID=UPI001488B1F9|nr:MULTISPECIES: YceI family protein [unclassified Streptomyces]